jgi:hypothetical protein
VGQETRCRARYGAVEGEVALHLDSETLELRGALRRRIERASVPVEAADGVLRMALAEGPLELALGAEAERWAQRLRTRRSRLEKLGIVAGSRVAVEGVADEALRAELTAAAAAAERDLDTLVWQVARREELAALAGQASRVRRDGQLWVLRPRGAAAARTLGEDDVRAAALPLGWVDVKVLKVSEEISGVKLVRRRAAR